MIEVGSSSLISNQYNALGALSHRNPFDLDSNSEGSDFEAHDICYSGMIEPMKRAKTTDVNSGSPLLINGEKKL